MAPPSFPVAGPPNFMARPPASRLTGVCPEGSIRFFGILRSFTDLQGLEASPHAFQRYVCVGTLLGCS